MDNKTDYTNIAAVVADELLSIGAVFLSSWTSRSHGQAELKARFIAITDRL